MDLVLIGKLMDMLEKSSLDTLDVSEGDMRIRLSKTPQAPAPADKPSHAAPAETPEMSAEAEIASLLALRTAETEEPVRAGLAGNFHRAPSPGAPLYAREGDFVEQGQTLGLIEAMNVPHPIAAPKAGTLRRFLIEDGKAVTAGMPVIIIDYPA